MSLTIDYRQDTATSPRSGQSGLDLAMPRLLMEDGTIIACLRRYDGSHTVIGRHPSADLCLPYDPHISGIHASLTWSDELQAHVLNDLGSSNGTFLDGARIRRPAQLANGASIRVGLTNIVYCRKLPVPGYVSTLARRINSIRRIDAQQRDVCDSAEARA
jgi:hypothetical protein